MWVTNGRAVARVDHLQHRSRLDEVPRAERLAQRVHHCARVSTICRASGRRQGRRSAGDPRSSDSGLCATGSGRRALPVIRHASASTTVRRAARNYFAVDEDQVTRSTSAFTRQRRLRPVERQHHLELHAASRSVAKVSLPVFRTKITRR